MLRRLVCLWVTLLAAPALTAAGVDAYGRLPSIEQAALSPDGTRIAFVKTTQDWRLLAIVDLNEAKLVGGVRLGDVKLRSVEWADDDHLLLTTASSTMPMGLYGERTEWHLISVYDLKTNKLSGLLYHVHGETRTMNAVSKFPPI